MGELTIKKKKIWGIYIFFILGALRNDLSDLVQGRPVSDELESLIIKKKKMKCFRSIGLKIIFRNIYGKMIKQLIFLTVFIFLFFLYISYESCVKHFLKWFINKLC